MTRFSLARRLVALGAFALVTGVAHAKDITLLNVSYDPGDVPEPAERMS